MVSVLILMIKIVQFVSMIKNVIFVTSDMKSIRSSGAVHVRPVVTVLVMYVNPVPLKTVINA